MEGYETQKNRLRLQCPMPKLNFDKITLAHGSGGQLTHQLLDTGVFKLLKNEHLDKQHDGAIIELNGKIAMSTDSFVISPIFFPGGNIGELAVNGTVNDLAMCGAKARYLSLSFILEEGLPMNDLWEILLSIKWAAEKAGVMIITGDTKVVEKGKGDKIFINTTGIGELFSQSHIDVDRVHAGDKVLISGPLATHGISILSVREGLEFESTIESDTQNLNFVVEALIKELGAEIKLLRDPTRGGLATILHEISQASKLGIDIQESPIPIDTQVKSACELLGLDPLYVANEGLFLSIVSADVAEKALEIMRSFPESKKAAIIGEIVADHPKQVLLRSGIGGKRVIHMMVGEQLPRIC